MAKRRFFQMALAGALVVLPLCAQAAMPSIDTDTLALQVALDRAGFSPGVVDGTLGQKTRQAIRAFQEANGLPLTGDADAQTRGALGEETDPTATVMITEADAAGPFVHVPESMTEKAKLDWLGYSSIEETLAEKYHTSIKTLRVMNPSGQYSAGSQIIVPAVRPAELAAASADKWDVVLDQLSVSKTQALAAKVIVDKSDRAVRVYDETGKLVAQFPASIGSEHDPLPIGEWKINGVGRLPPFHYNPKLFWDAGAKDTKTTLPPGPNGPVGVVWIDLSKDHYGIHGTPEPEMIGRTQSHGCIRLTNWDAAKLAQMVKPGTPAVLED